MQRAEPMKAYRLEELKASARHATDRFRLYRARVSGPQPTSPVRLGELEREAQRAERTLARALEAETNTSTRR